MEKIKKYAKYIFTENPLVGWGILGIVVWLLFSSFFFGFCVFIVGLIIFFNNQAKEKKKREEEHKNLLKEEAKKLVEIIKSEKRLTKIQPSVFLDAGETAFLEESSVLFETRAVRKSTGAGIGFRVMKGVHVGGYQGQSESHQEMKSLDSGNLIITNKKLIFRGSKENRAIPLSKIMGLKMYSDAIEIASSSRQKGSTFSVNNPYIWNVVVYVLRSVENPLDFSNIEKIDISIE